MNDYHITTGFTSSQEPSRFETFWANKLPLYLEISGIPAPGEPGYVKKLRDKPCLFMISQSRLKKMTS
jgi:hypothetical protein